MNIKWRLIGQASVSLAFLLVIGIFGAGKLADMGDAVHQSATAAETIRNHMAADMMHDALRSDVLAAALASTLKQAGRRGEIEKDLNKHVTLFQTALQENEALSLKPEIASALKKVKPLLENYIKESQSMVATAFDKPDELEAKMPQFMVAFSALETEMEAVSELIEASAAQAKAGADAALSSAKKLAALVFAVAGACLAIFSFLNIRSILGSIRQLQQAVESMNSGEADLTYRLPSLDGEFAAVGDALNRFISKLNGIVANVKTATETIATASEQIAAGNLDLSSRTEQQASSLQETASSMEELTSTVKQNGDHARQVNQLAGAASDVAVKGGAVVSHVVDTMGSINESAKKIVDIIGVIDGIAFQTNILALNAAVEAARAGEQGRGFAVVASEVRNLAQRSAAAAKEIKSLIGDSVEKVDAGSRLVNQAGSTMEEVVASVKRVNDIIAEITAASSEQEAGIEQINQAISQMDSVTQQNASLVEEAAAAAESLQDQAANLARVVSVFKVDEVHAAGELVVHSHRAEPRQAPAKPLLKKSSAPVIPKNNSASRQKINHVAAGASDEWEQF